jgi:molybdate transport system substrate-binding protein
MGRVGLLAVAAGLLLGCTAGTRPVGGAQRTRVTVFAAASLTEAFGEVKGAFEKASPAWEVRLSFGASSQLRAQIEQGAPADVFASADGEQMTPLVKTGRVSGPRVFARNRLAVVVPASNPGRIRSVKELARPGLRLVTTSVAVPIGRYTQEALGKLDRLPGYGADFTARVNRNVVSRETNVRGVLAKVELGEADGAIVYETDGRSTPRVKVLPIPEKANVVAEYPIVVVRDGPARAGGEAFSRFVLSKAGQEVLRRYGFR